MADYPKLKEWWNGDKRLWYVRVTWAPNEYTRHSLGTAIDNEVPEALATFAAAKLHQLVKERSVAEPAPRDPGESEIARAIEWFLNTHLRTMRFKPKTIDDYTHILDRFKKYAAFQKLTAGNQLTTRFIQEWQIARIDERKTGDSQNAQRAELLILRRFLADAQAAGEITLRNFIAIVADNGERKQVPAIKWDIPSKPKSKRYKLVPDATLKNFIEEIEQEKPAWSLPLLWMTRTPWLPSDTRDFRIREDKGDVIDRERIKTSRDICYPITPDLRELIERGKFGRNPRPQETVFVNPAGKPWTKDELEGRFIRWARPRGYDFCFRDLRVTWATNMAPLCLPNELAELMGVEDVTTVYQFYVRVDLQKMAIAQKRFASRLAALQAGEPTDNTILPYVLPKKTSHR